MARFGRWCTNTDHWFRAVNCRFNDIQQRWPSLPRIQSIFQYFFQVVLRGAISYNTEFQRPLQYNLELRHLPDNYTFMVMEDAMYSVQGFEVGIACYFCLSPDCWKNVYLLGSDGAKTSSNVDENVYPNPASHLHVLAGILRPPGGCLRTNGSPCHSLPYAYKYRYFIFRA